MTHARSLGARLTFLPVFVSIALLAACGGGGGGGVTPPDETEGASIPNELLVGVRAGTLGDPALEAVIAGAGTILRSDERGSVYRIRLHDGLTQDDGVRLLVHSDIVYVEKNYLAYGFAAPADGAAYTASYSAAVRAELQAGWSAYGALTPANTVTLAIIDTGIRATHDDLKNKVDLTNAFDFNRP